MQENISPEPSGLFAINEKAIKKYTLHKRERVKKRNDIDLLFRTGKTFALFPYRVYYSLQKRETIAEQDTGHKEKELPLQFGVTVSKKYFKKAVDRNRVKRLTREAYRLQKLPLLTTVTEKGELYVKLFFIYTGKEVPAFDMVKKKFFLFLKNWTNILKPIEETFLHIKPAFHLPDKNLPVGAFAFVGR